MLCLRQLAVVVVELLVQALALLAVPVWILLVGHQEQQEVMVLPEPLLWSLSFFL